MLTVGIEMQKQYQHTGKEQITELLKIMNNEQTMENTDQQRHTQLSKTASTLSYHALCHRGLHGQWNRCGYIVDIWHTQAPHCRCGAVYCQTTVIVNAVQLLSICSSSKWHMVSNNRDVFLWCLSLELYLSPPSLLPPPSLSLSLSLPLSPLIFPLSHTLLPGAKTD